MQVSRLFQWYRVDSWKSEIEIFLLLLLNMDKKIASDLEVQNNCAYIWNKVEICTTQVNEFVTICGIPCSTRLSINCLCKKIH